MSSKDKIVVRDLPFWVSKQTLEAWVATHASTSAHAPAFTLVRLKKGKPANRQKNRPAIPVWAIFSCKEPKLAANLASAFDGVTLPAPEEFVDVAGISSPTVEYCPLQSKATAAATPAEDDDTCGTIFSDDKFLSFVAKLNIGKAPTMAPEASNNDDSVTSPVTPAQNNTAEKVKELIRLAEEKAAQRLSESSAGTDKLIRGIVKKVKAKAKLKKDVKITKAPTSGEKKQRREEEKKRKREEKEKLLQLIERKREQKREQKEQKAKIAAQATSNVASSKTTSASTGGSRFTVSTARQGCGANKPPTAKDLRMMPALPGDITPPSIIVEPTAPPQTVTKPILLKRNPQASQTQSTEDSQNGSQKSIKTDGRVPQPSFSESQTRFENETCSDTKKIGKATLKNTASKSRPVPAPVGDTNEQGSKPRQAATRPPPPLGDVAGDITNHHEDPHSHTRHRHRKPKQQEKQ